MHQHEKMFSSLTKTPVNNLRVLVENEIVTTMTFQTFVCNTHFGLLILSLSLDLLAFDLNEFKTGQNFCIEMVTVL